MSKSWAKGSTRAWRKTRALVLARDGWVCQLCHRAIDPQLRPPHPGSATVHHTLGKRYGDNPAHLVAAHRKCNLDVGDPTTQPDPPAEPVTKW
ncbi:HNH endonuclease [Saccharomonospora cyanea]|uniref:HNH nuclease domain-containing protein n=1 Tax=Saccharomonospora cyanea NA-134 TaxID=882082 RepID=H5XG59_9PSEU|nr:HNH endonuclease [Saccharomonospora cyanea]EHR62641.1 hypothetical protein SaccyDRAFT_3814 [Saccharomonospora cyanea NA-134]